MASIPFGIEFDRIAPPVPTIVAAAEYDAARSRRTIDFFFERLRLRCIGRLQRLDGDPATGRNRREGAIHWHQGEGPLATLLSHSDRGLRRTALGHLQRSGTCPGASALPQQADGLTAGSIVCSVPEADLYCRRGCDG